MNKFFYFLAIFCLFTLGSCEKDVQPDIAAGDGIRVNTSFDPIDPVDPRNEDGRGGDGRGDAYIQVDIDNYVGSGATPQDFLNAIANVGPNDVVTGDVDIDYLAPVFLAASSDYGSDYSNTDYEIRILCKFNPNYYLQSYIFTPITGTGSYNPSIQNIDGNPFTSSGPGDVFLPESIEWIIEEYPVSGDPTTTLLQYGINSQLPTTTSFDFDFSTGTDYYITLRTVLAHATTGFSVTHNTSLCLSIPSLDGPICPIGAISVCGGCANGGPGTLTVIGFMPSAETEIVQTSDD